MRSRLRGDLDQMTDEALRRDQPDSSGNLSNVPLHMADVGTENYDQEFTLGLIENEQGTLEQVNEALEPDQSREVRPLRGMRRADRQAPASGPAVHAPLHSMCAEAGESRMNEAVPVPRWVLFWSIALGGAAFDLVTKSLVFARIGPPPPRPVALIPNVLELHTSYNRGALWGLGRNLPHSSLIFAALSIVAARGDLLVPVRQAGRQPTAG